MPPANPNLDKLNSLGGEAEPSTSWTKERAINQIGLIMRLNVSFYSSPPPPPPGANQVNPRGSLFKASNTLHQQHKKWIFGSIFIPHVEAEIFYLLLPALHLEYHSFLLPRFFVTISGPHVDSQLSHFRVLIHRRKKTLLIQIRWSIYWTGWRLLSFNQSI